MKDPIELGNGQVAIVADMPPGEPAVLKLWRDRQEFILNPNEPFVHLKFLTVKSIDDITVVLSRMRNAMVRPTPGAMEVVET